ncbi:hypothetical protein EW026_g3011 [Hermanssonia centrifuga]|uniref:Uncharacterized protein n=1 Tax=Hermanssonia centrifuga TaxID=98765 RepID=A0A4S4KMJ2_9APHY|nr:hypothetical protein EW026_g3011 [Hermanssonia centrifuga]
MHRKRLLNRISSADGRALAGYANKPGLLPNSKRLSLVLDDTAVKSTHRIGPYSQGLRRWAERPCFEDRVIVYLPSSDSETGLRQERVYATNAVEALGYSEELELLAGLDDIQLREDMLEFSFSPVTPELSFTPSTASLASAPPSPLLTASPPTTSTKQFPSVMYKPAPSPLRRESTESAPQLQLIPTSGSVSSPFLTVPTSPAASPSPPSPAISPATTKPAVRFAEDSDESIPLDYVMRYKQARDHKAKFLAAEKARRLEEQGREASARRAQEDARRIADERRRLEEARRKHEAERRKQEQERKNWEQERANWDRERRAIEEEKRQRTIHDELADARRRRESSRVGAVPKSNEGMVAWEGDREKERARRNQEARENYSRPTYDRAASPVPRRQSSDAIVPSGGASPSGSRNNIPFVNSSPGSSRPPSIAATGSVRGSSRPPSMYSTPPSSASDVRARRESKTSRRTSIVSDNPYGQQPMFLHPGTPTGGYPWGMVPPVPPMPMNMNVMPVAMPMPMMSMPMPAMAYTDLPLLPPAAPFMMHQFGQRSPNHRSHSSSPTRAKGEGSERGKDSPQNAHRRKASSDAIPATSGSSPYTQPQQQHSAASLRSSRSANPSMQQGQPPSVQRPTPVTTTSWGKQPGFQNLSRPQSNRRQTMIT